MSDQKFRIAWESLDQFIEQKDLVSPVGGLKKETGLKLKPEDLEAKITRTIKDNGEVEVQFLYPLDDNDEVKDGRLYLEDTFSYGPHQANFNNFKRRFLPPQNIKDPLAKDEWENKLKLYQKLKVPSNYEASPFALAAGRTFSDALNDRVFSVLDKHRLFLRQILKEARTQNKNWKLKAEDPDSHFSFRYSTNQIEISLSFVIDDDDDATNGRVIVQDTFVVDAETKAFKGHTRRHWKAAPDSEGHAATEAAVKKLNQEDLPEDQRLHMEAEGSEALVRDLGVAVLPLDWEGFHRQLAQISQGTKIELKPSVAIPEIQDEKKKRAQVHEESLNIAMVVGSEILGRRYDGDQGWWDKGTRFFTGRNEMNLNGEMAALNSLRDKAIKRIQDGKGNEKSLSDILGSLDLTEEEKRVRDRVMGHRVMKEINSLSRETDDELRYEALAHLAKRSLMLRHSLGGSAVEVAKLIQEKGNDLARADAGELLAIAEGREGTGLKLEYMGHHAAKEIAKPSMLFAMMGAGVLGVGTEASIFSRLSQIPRMAAFSRPLSIAGGVLAESASFTGLHKTWESAGTNTAKVWHGTWNEFKSGTALFAFTRAAHGVTGAISTKLAKGEWLPSLSRPATTTAGPTYLQTPLGRIIPSPVTRELTTKGMIVTETLNHTAGVMAMFGSGYFSQWWGWQEGSKHGAWGNFFDSLLMYTHAMAGFNLANRLTGGQLHATVAGGRMRLQEMRLAAMPKGLSSSGSPLVDFLGRKIPAFDRWIKGLEAQRNAAHGERDAAMAERDALQQSLQQNLARQAQLQTELEAAAARETKLRQDFSTRKSISKGQAKQLQRAEREVQDLKVQLARLEAQRIAAERQATEINISASPPPSGRPSPEEVIAALKPAKLPAEAAQTLTGEALVLREKLTEAEGRIATLEGELATARGELEVTRVVSRSSVEVDGLRLLEVARGEAVEKEAQLSVLRSEKEAQGQKLQQAESDLAEARGTVARLEAEAAGLRAQLGEVAELNGREQELLGRIQTLETERSRIQSEADTFAEALRQAQAENEKIPVLARDLAEGATKLAELQRQFDASQEALRLSEQRLEVKRREVEAQESQIEDRRNHVTRLSKELREAKEAKEGLERQAEEIRVELEALNQDKQANSERIAELAAQLQVESTQAQQAGAKATDLEGKLERKTKALEASQIELEKAQKDLIKARELNNRLSADASERERAMSDTIRDQQAEIDRLRNEILDKQGEILEKDGTLGEQRKSLEEKERELEGLRSRLDGAERANEHARHKVTELESEVRTKNRELRDQEKKIGKLEGELTEERAKLQQAQTDAEALGAQLRREIEARDNQITDLKGQVDAANERSRQAGERIIELDAELTSLRGALERLQGEKTTLEAELAKVKEEKQESEDNLNSIVNQLTELVEAKEQEVGELQENLENLSRALAEEQATVAGLRENLAAKETELDRAYRKLAEAEARGNDYERQLTLLQHIHESTEGELRQTKADLKTQLELAEQAAQDIIRLNRDLETQRKATSAALQTLESTRTELNRVNEAMSDAEVKAKEDIAQLEEKLTTREGELREALEKLLAETGRADQNQRTIEGLNETIRLNEAEIARLNESIRSEINRAGEAVRRGIDLERQLAQQQHEYDMEKSRADILESDLAQVRQAKVDSERTAWETIQQLQTNIEELRASVTTEQATVTRLEGELETVRREKHEADMDFQQEKIRWEAEMDQKVQLITSHVHEIDSLTAQRAAAYEEMGRRDTAHREEVARLEAELASEQGNVEQLRANLGTLQEARERADQLAMEQIEGFRVKILEKEEALETKRGELRDLEDQVRRAEHERDLTNSVAKERAQAFLKQIGEKENAITEKTAEAKRLKAELETAEKSFQRSLREREGRVQELEAEVAQLRGNLETAKETEQLKDGEIALIQGSLDEKVLELNTLREEADGIISGLNELLRVEQDRGNQEMNRANAAEREAAASREKAYTLEVDLREARRVLLERATEIEEKRLELERINSLLEMAQHEIEAHQTGVRRLSEEKQSLSDDLAEKESSIPRLQQRLEEARGTEESLRRQIHELEDYLRTQDQTLAQKDEQLAEQAAQAIDQAHQANRHYGELQQQWEAAQRQVGELAIQLGESQAQVDALRSAAEALGRAHSGLEEQVTHWKGEAARHQLEAQQARDDLAMAQDRTEQIQLPTVQGGQALEEGHSFSLDPMRMTFIGRHKLADLILTERNVGRIQAKVRSNGDHFEIMDLGGGEYQVKVNAQAVGPAWRELADGDVVGFGNGKNYQDRVNLLRGLSPEDLAKQPELDVGIVDFGDILLQFQVYPDGSEPTLTRVISGGNDYHAVQAHLERLGRQSPYARDPQAVDTPVQREDPPDTSGVINIEMEAEPPSPRPRKRRAATEKGYPMAGDYKGVSASEAIPLAMKYKDAFTSLYGGDSLDKTIPFANLYSQFPELEAQFTPAMLAQASSRRQQIQTLDILNNYLQTQEGRVNSATLDAARADAKRIAEAQRPFGEWPENHPEVLVIGAKYRDSLGALFGARGPEVAKSLADIYHNVPALEETLNPEIIFEALSPAHVPRGNPSEVTKAIDRYFTRTVKPPLHSDRQKLNEVSLFENIDGRVVQLQSWLKESAEHQVLSYFRPPNPSKFQLQSWPIEAGKQLMGGRKMFREESTLVSRKHFLIQQDGQNGQWLIQDQGTANGTFVDGQKVEKNGLYLQNGSLIELGHDGPMLNFYRNGDDAFLIEAYRFAFPPGTSFNVGRNSSCEAVIYDPEAAPVQLHGVWHNNSWFFRTMDLNYPVYWKGQLVEKMEFMPVEPGQTLRLGMADFYFQVHSDGEIYLEQASKQNLAPPTSRLPTPPMQQIISPPTPAPTSRPVSFRNGTLTFGDQVATIRAVISEGERVEWDGRVLKIPFKKGWVGKLRSKIKDSSDLFNIVIQGGNNFAIHGMGAADDILVTYPGGEFHPLKDGTELPLKPGSKIRVQGQDILFQP